MDENEQSKLLDFFLIYSWYKSKEINILWGFLDVLTVWSNFPPPI